MCYIGGRGRVELLLLLLLLFQELLLVDLTETELALLGVEHDLLLVLVVHLDGPQLALDVVERLVLDALPYELLEAFGERGVDDGRLTRRVIELDVLLHERVLRTHLGAHLAAQLPRLLFQLFQHRLVDVVDFLFELLAREINY